MDKKKTGDLIKDARIRKNYTQSELGGLLGVTNKAVSRWENGESFPDIGLLENLSNLLDIKIQDIVVGEIRADDETAFTEIVRLAKLQAKAKRKKIGYFATGIIITLYSCFIGGAGLTGNGVFVNDLGMIYMISLAIILMIFLYGIILEKKEGTGNFKEADGADGKVNKYMLIASVISGIWVILTVCFASVMLGNGIVPFHMDIASVGPFLNNQLIAAFLLNIAILTAELYRICKKQGDIHKGIFVLISVFSVLYLAALYADVLHRLTTVEIFFRMIFFRTIIVLAELFMFAAAVLVLMKDSKKS